MVDMWTYLISESVHSLNEQCELVSRGAQVLLDKCELVVRIVLWAGLLVRRAGPHQIKCDLVAEIVPRAGFEDCSQSLLARRARLPPHKCELVSRIVLRVCWRGAQGSLGINVSWLQGFRITINKCCAGSESINSTVFKVSVLQASQRVKSVMLEHPPPRTLS